MIFQDDHQNYYISGVLFITISAVIMQIILMSYEYKTQVPMFFAHKIYWAFNWLFQPSLLYQSFSMYFVACYYRINIDLYTLCFYLELLYMDLAEFETLGFWRNQLPMIDLSESQRSRISTVNSQSSFFLKIVLKKQWNIVDGDIEIKLDIRQAIQTKKKDFRILLHYQQYILENNEYFEQHSNDLLQINFLIKQIQENQDLLLIHYIQRYFEFITSKLELITPCFADFIELQSSEKQLIEEMKLATHSQNLHKSYIIGRKNQPKKCKWDIQAQYLPYKDFKITEFQTIKTLSEPYVLIVNQMHINIEKNNNTIYNDNII
ncbi:unnamed protein product [Paramecium octaurelia]|uniref:Transmembrane protein n=1 Tax=Paramecium octaurelia TaxID=43137 RepID=A0A8S1S7H5_PAROT|nr:unnamed protein product [Paramecium octaurelia]